MGGAGRAVDPVLHGAWFENWTLIPRDASGDLNLCPIISRVCSHCSWISLILAAGVHLTQGYSGTTSCARHTIDPGISYFFMMTGNLAVAGLFFEVAWMFSIRFMGLASMYKSEVTLRKRLRLNIKMFVVFLVLAICYHLLAFDAQVVHSGWLAQQYGGHQLVYSLRFVEWTLMSPLILSVLGQLEHSPEGHARNGLIPSSMLTGFYVIISWQGLVVTNKVCAWVLIGFAFACYFAASAEQITFAWYIKDKGKSGPLRAGTLIFLVLLMGVFGVMFLLPIPGVITTTLENKFYCFGDAIFKLGTASMLLVSEDVCATVEMWRRAVVFAEDQATLIDKASVPIFGVDRDGLINHLNEKAYKLLPLAEDKIMGTPLYDVLPEGDRQKCKQMIESVLSSEPEPESEKSTILETSIVMPDQRARDKERDDQAPILELSASVRRSKTGKVMGVTLIGHDITAYKQAEERKARFMATMSHELRSPLHGIIGLSEHLASDEEDPTKSTSLKMITKCSKRLLGLVVDIMDMASLSVRKGACQSRQIVLHKDPVELGKIIEEVITLVRSSNDKFGKPLVKRGVQLVNKFTSLPVIEADAAKCTQIFFNLLTNACKFTKKGSVTFSCRHLAEGHPQVGDDEGDWVEVSVTDTGSGISPQNLERIFRPFEQEDNSMSRGHDGLGLGLAIANEVVKLHGGRIHVTSDLGVGTTFTVRLPVVAKDCQKMAQITDASPEPAPQEETVEPRRSSKLRRVQRYVSEDSDDDATPHPPPQQARRPGKPLILSVDDDSVNHTILDKQLGGEHDIVKVLSGEQACQYLKRNPAPDLMLLDYMMPGMHGMEVLKFVRQELHLGPMDLPIIMVTAADQAAGAEALDLGCNDYVTKPFEASVLRARVKSLLSRKAQCAPQTARAPVAPKLSLPVDLRAGGRSWTPRSSCFSGVFCSPR